MSARLQSRAPSRARDDIVTSRALRRSIGVAPFLILDVVKVSLALLISIRIRPRALELF